MQDSCFEHVADCPETFIFVDSTVYVILRDIMQESILSLQILTCSYLRAGSQWLL